MDFNTDELLNILNNNLKQGLNDLLKDFIRNYKLYEETHNAVLKLPSVVHKINSSFHELDTDKDTNKETESLIVIEILKKQIANLQNENQLLKAAQMCEKENIKLVIEEKYLEEEEKEEETEETEEEETEDEESEEETETEETEMEDETEEDVKITDLTVDELRDIIKDIISAEMGAEAGMEMGAEDEMADMGNDAEVAVDLGSEDAGIEMGAEDEIDEVDLDELLAEIDALEGADDEKKM